MFLKYSQAYASFSHFKGDSTAPPCSSVLPPHLPCEGWRSFHPQSRLRAGSTGNGAGTTVILSCRCASADGEREAGTTRLAPSTSSPQTCHPSRLLPRCPRHRLTLGRLGKSPCTGTARWGAGLRL